MKRALVLSLVVAMGLGFAAFAQGELTGSWATTITIDPAGAIPWTPTGPNFFTFSSDLTVNYSVGGWIFTSVLGVDSSGFSKAYFTAGGSFGAFNIASTMKFTPGGDFTSWEVDTSFLFGSVDIGIGFDLYGQNVGLTLSGSASTGLVDIDIAMYFGDLYWDPLAGAAGEWVDGDNVCDLDWRGVDITVAFPFDCADVTAVLKVTCDGFQSLCLSVAGVDIPNLPWVDLSAKLCFELESKTLVLTPVFDFGADVCFDLYICQYNIGGTGPLTALTLGDFYVAGIGLSVEFGGVSFSGISFWAPTECPKLVPKALKGYWEMYKIATTDEACCGPFDFDIAVFFDVDSVYLFDIAAFAANFSYELGENFIFKMGLDYTAASGLTKWTIGFTITW